MLVLGIESSCDETAAAVVEGSRVRSSVVATQHDLHAEYGGVVPEIASRAHEGHILPVLRRAVRDAGIELKDLDAIAVGHRPGLVGSLLIGLSAAKALSWSLGVPLVGVDHVHAHLYAAALDSDPIDFPALGLVVSGGHTTLYAMESETGLRRLGGTIDDAAGEAFDKVASMLGLPFPGGPAVSRMAVGGNRAAHRFPRTFLNEPERLQFSFSGLKTAVRYQLVGPGKSDFSQLALPPEQVADLCASFEEAVVDCLVGKSVQAMQATGMDLLCVGGGVAANRRLRERLSEAAQANGFRLIIAPMELCTDNAVMGAIAIERIKAGLFEPLDLDILPGLVRS